MISKIERSKGGMAALEVLEDVFKTREDGRQILLARKGQLLTQGEFEHISATYKLTEGEVANFKFAKEEFADLTDKKGSDPAKENKSGNPAKENKTK